MRVLYIEPVKPPRILDIDHTLDAMQSLVGGSIEAVYPWPEDYCALVCNEDGIALGLPYNRVLEDYDIIKGPFFICGIGVEDFTDLSEELIEKYRKKFAASEIFLPTPDGHLAVLKIVSSPMEG